MTIQYFTNDKIHDNPHQVAGRVDPAELAELADSIKEHGLKHIPQARQHPGKPGHVQLVAGHRRRVAWFMNSKEPMPLDVMDGVSDREMFENNVIENNQRADLNPLQKASQMQAYIDAFGVSQAVAGKLFGLANQGSVSNVLRLLKLPAPIQELAATGELSQRHARKFVTAVEIVPVKQLTRIAKSVAAARTDNEKEDIIADDLEAALLEYGRNLSFAEWDLQWPGKPIPVDPRNAGKDGWPTEIAACKNCPFNVALDGARLCTQPLCFDLKAAHWKGEALQRASKKLGIPIGDLEQAKSEYFHVIFDGTNYARSMDARRLIQANRPTELGLFLLESQADGSAYYAKDVFGYDGISLGTGKKDACAIYLKRFDKNSDETKPGKKQQKSLSPEAVKKEEEAEQAARRQERALALRAKYDVSWLVTNTARLVGERLALSGSVLDLVNEAVSYSISSDYDIVHEHLNALEDRLNTVSGAERDRVHCELLALKFIGSELHGYKAEYDFDAMQRSTERLVTGKGAHDYEQTFKLKLPAGWDKPPIHRTEFNCWHCGAFASSTRITKRDQAEGWEQSIKDKKVADVRCPSCATDANGKTPAAAKAKGKKK